MSETGPDELLDQVAALERTALSWERTAIGLAAAGAFLFKITADSPIARASGLVLIAFAVALIVVVIPLGYRGARQALDPAHPETTRTLAQGWRMRRFGLLTTTVVMVVTVLAIAVELFLKA